VPKDKKIYVILMRLFYALAFIFAFAPIQIFSEQGFCMHQTFSELTDDDKNRLEEQRKIITKYLDENSVEKFKTPAGKLGTLRALLTAKVFKPEQTYELQSMGIVLGDVFVQDKGFHWIMVEDEYGRDPAIKFEDTSIIAFPLTMISKRIERGEEVDVFDLYNGVADTLIELIEEEKTDSINKK
jgi:hypothetical protein